MGVWRLSPPLETRLNLISLPPLRFLLSLVVPLLSPSLYHSSPLLFIPFFLVPSLRYLTSSESGGLLWTKLNYVHRKNEEKKTKKIEFCSKLKKKHFTLP